MMNYLERVMLVFELSNIIIRDGSILLLFYGVGMNYSLNLSKNRDMESKIKM
jgi:hypothetical protein